MPSRPVNEAVIPIGSTSARSERLSRLKKLWHVVRGHMIGEVPIEDLDINSESRPSNRTARPAAGTRDGAADAAPSGRDASVDEASDDSFPASDPPSSTASRV